MDTNLWQKHRVALICVAGVVVVGGCFLIYNSSITHNKNTQNILNNNYNDNQMVIHDDDDDKQIEITGDSYKGITNDLQKELNRIQIEYKDNYQSLYPRKWINAVSNNTNDKQIDIENTEGVEKDICSYLNKNFYITLPTGKKIIPKAEKPEPIINAFLKLKFKL